VNGPLARRIADLRTALGVLAGPTWRDPWSAAAPLRGPGISEPIKVALVLDPAGAGTAAQVRDGVRTAGEALADAGYEVDELEPPSIEAAALALLHMLSTPGTRLGWQQFMEPIVPDETRRFMTAFFEAAREPDASTAEQAFMTRQTVLRQWGAFFAEHPLVVAPICTEPPARAGTDLDDGAVAHTIATMRMAMAVNALGLPAVALPVGVADGLPQAVQVIGDRYREDLCLDAAEAIELRRGTITPIDPR
jgi:amidase